MFESNYGANKPPPFPAQLKLYQQTIARNFDPPNGSEFEKKIPKKSMALIRFFFYIFSISGPF